MITQVSSLHDGLDNWQDIQECALLTEVQPTFAMNDLYCLQAAEALQRCQQVRKEITVNSVLGPYTLSRLLGIDHN